MSGLYEVATWLVYALAALMVLAAIATAFLAGLTLRFVAVFLRELDDKHEAGDTQHDQDGSKSPE